jgi:hypothetical protein
MDRFLKGDSKNENLDFQEWKRNRNIVTYEEIESIKYITELHREVLKDQTFYQQSDYYGMNNFVIAYWMKDGSTVIRHYTLTATNQEKNQDVKTQIANKLINSNDFKRQNYYYLYDKDYYEGRNLYVRVKNIKDYNIVYEEVKIDHIRDALIKDIENLKLSKDKAFNELFLNTGYYSKEYMLNEPGYVLEIYEKLSNADEKYFSEIYIDKNYVNTLKYLN